MSKRLIIAEKPSVAMNISQAIDESFSRKDGFVESKSFIISWCVGHLVGLASPEKYIEGAGKADKKRPWKLEDLPIIPARNGWKLTANKDTKDQYKILVSLMNDDSVKDIVCATDAGREGELIFRYVYNTSRSKKPVLRLWVSSMESEAILAGLASMKPDSAYDDLFQAGFSRARADWLVGMNGTRLYTCRYGSLVSVGRVQTATLAAIAKRDDEIRNFVSKPFYQVGIKDDTRVLGLTDRYDDRSEAEKVRTLCDGKDALVKELKKETKTQNPPKLFDLTSLQRQANKNFGYTAAKTLDYTQSLYEKKLVTYPRTDSSYITTDMENTVRSLFGSIVKELKGKYGIDVGYSPNIKRVTNDKKVSDHHAIIPTKEIFKADISSLSKGEQDILHLVVQRFVCAMGEPRKTEVTKAVFDVEGISFKGNGTKSLVKGYFDAETLLTKAFWGKELSDEDKPLPDLKQGQIIPGVRAGIKDGQTTPPKHFTEDSLLAFMETAGNDDYDEDSDAEKKGIGTPATRAGIIEKLVDRKYIVREKKNLLITPAGETVVKIVPEKLKSAKMTAEWEMRLREVEKGELSSESFMDDIEEFTRTLISSFTPEKGVSLGNRSGAECLGQCPKCQADVLSGKYGAYCTRKCGMYLSKVRGKTLTDTQVKKLLSGKEISITVEKKKFKVLPEVEDFDYTTKDGKRVTGSSFKSMKVLGNS